MYELDVAITEWINSLAGNRLLDHVVVSRGGHVSLAERGWL